MEQNYKDYIDRYDKLVESNENIIKQYSKTVDEMTRNERIKGIGNRILCGVIATVFILCYFLSDYTYNYNINSNNVSTQDANLSIGGDE